MLKRTIKANFDAYNELKEEWKINFHSLTFEVEAETEKELNEKLISVVKPFVTKSNVILVTKPFINTQRNPQGPSKDDRCKPDAQQCAALMGFCRKQSQADTIRSFEAVVGKGATL